MMVRDIKITCDCCGDDITYAYNIDDVVDQNNKMHRLFYKTMPRYDLCGKCYCNIKYIVDCCVNTKDLDGIISRIRKRHEVE